jgi:hypothetical protein
MYSKLRPSLCYKNISPEIAPHDQDIDAEEWDYNGRIVYRGNVDPNYISDKLSVYWLYDSDLNRVGLSEHETEDETKFESLWIRGDEFSTLLQEDWTSLDKTIWSILSPEAYQDCLEDDFSTIVERVLTSDTRLISPSMVEKQPDVNECERCGKKSISELKGCSTVKKNYIISNRILFIDSNFIIYVPPVNSSIWSKYLHLPMPSYDEKLSSLVEETLQPEEPRQLDSLLEPVVLVQQ